MSRPLQAVMQGNKNSHEDLCKGTFHSPLLALLLECYPHPTASSLYPLYWTPDLSCRSGEAYRSSRPSSSRLTRPVNVDMSYRILEACYLLGRTSFINLLVNLFSISWIRSSISRITSSRVSASITALRISDSKSWGFSVEGVWLSYGNEPVIEDALFRRTKPLPTHSKALRLIHLLRPRPLHVL